MCKSFSALLLSVLLGEIWDDRIRRGVAVLETAWCFGLRIPVLLVPRVLTPLSSGAFFAVPSSMALKMSKDHVFFLGPVGLQFMTLFFQLAPSSPVRESSLSSPAAEACASSSLSL